MGLTILEKRMIEMKKLSDRQNKSVQIAIERLIDDHYDYRIEMWGDPRIKALCVEPEKTLATYFAFNEGEEDKAVSFLDGIIEALEGVRVEKVKQIRENIANGKLLPPVGKCHANIYKGRVARVIGGKVYDTDKATLISETLESGFNEARFIYERTYQTQKGNLFKVVHGGAYSGYGKEVATNVWQDDIKVLPITKGGNND